MEELEGPFYSLSFFCLFDLYLGCCSEASISGMEILEVDWECLGSSNSRVSDQPHSENNPWDQSQGPTRSHKSDKVVICHDVNQTLLDQSQGRFNYNLDRL